MEKNQKISFLQIWGIILVVIGHSKGIEIIPFVHNWIYSFHMPLFMFISGFLFSYTNIVKGIPIHSIKLLGLNGFVFKKIKRLLIPGFIISSIIFLPRCILNDVINQSHRDLSLGSYIDMFLYPWHNIIAPYWFLPTLFIIFLIVLSFLKIFKMGSKTKILYCFIIISLILHLFNPLYDIKFLNLEGVINYLFYFLLGYICCEQGIHKIMFPKLGILFIASLILSIIFVLTPNFFAKDVIISINGIFLSIILANLYEKKKFTFLNHLYGTSYAIYLYSAIPQVLLHKALVAGYLSYSVEIILSIITGIYIPVILFYSIKSLKKFKIVKITAPYLGL